jgi:hypothetical protein
LRYLYVVSADTKLQAGELDEKEDPDEEAPGNTEVLALPAGPKVLLLMPYVQLPGTKFCNSKDDIAKIILRLYSFRG